MLSLERVSFAYRKRQACIDGLSLSLGAGQTLGLLGPNGAGKTTLASLVTGQLTPTSGQILFAGKPVCLGQQGIALVPQEYAFYARLSGRENLMFFAGLLNLPKNEQQLRVNRALASTELAAYADQKAGTFSGGLKRRLNFAIALLQQPQLMILDEPTANVDPQSRAFLLGTIAKLKQEGVAIIYTSHLLSEVEAIADKVALLHRGKILLAGELSELLAEDHRYLYIQLAQTAPATWLDALSMQREADNWYRCSMQERRHSPGEIISTLEQKGADIRQIRHGQHRLEEVYLRALADAEASL
ncbi:ABC transporter ATP-binding protein [Gilvimarinus sp. SDUM040013]|uniref:ABC transporter ATP-binding protein n=1 Tax=Gilvimarinus gilvus TaxID=3058038 RepID=A0ABU4S1M5_9GAMM|nr:ABC transporter ATP-binding protein [Gilvimarinus sp. SDUM040013]MDO3387801.1 ABC transporter ATP-binding protein [Gilvimarinus sp. SDUM040013]MDX6851056.1 ABC transporter ATP-binding protein [Gilvimarinus sp. SDUM040013]